MKENGRDPKILYSSQIAQVFFLSDEIKIQKGCLASVITIPQFWKNLHFSQRKYSIC